MKKVRNFQLADDNILTRYLIHKDKKITDLAEWRSSFS